METDQPEQIRKFDRQEIAESIIELEEKVSDLRGAMKGVIEYLREE